jgi:outer membrane protein assembly factor BamA
LEGPLFSLREDSGKEPKEFEAVVELARTLHQAFHIDRRIARGVVSGTPWISPLWIAVFLLIPAVVARADSEYMVSEEAIADMMVFEDHIPYFCPATYPGEPRRLDTEKRPWTILPLIGYGPATGLMGGAAFSHRNLFWSGVSLDLSGLYGFRGVQRLKFSLGKRGLAKNRLVLLLRGRFLVNPEREFYGLGMNDVGPDPLSTNAIQDGGVAMTAGWRFVKRAAFSLSLGARNVQIWCSEKNDSGPCTAAVFPGLPGIEGGWMSFVGLSVVWDITDSIVRPTRGWRFIVKAVHTNNLFVGEYEFTRFLGDASYHISFLQRRLVLGARINGELIAGPDGKIPYWELSGLGGRASLRGFPPHRFVGTKRILANAEARYRFAEFDFKNLWHIRIDGALFGDVGRVFIDENDLREEYALPEDALRKQTGGFQYSMGAGCHIGFSEALLARIDVGFSEENTGLVFLSFGHMF